MQESDRLTRLINELLLLFRFDKAGSNELEVEKTEDKLLTKVHAIANRIEVGTYDKRDSYTDT